MTTHACEVPGCTIHARHAHGPEAIVALLPIDASDPWLRVGMGGRLPGPSQASLGSPDWVASFAVTHPMWRDGYQYEQADLGRVIASTEMAAAKADFDRQCSTPKSLGCVPAAHHAREAEARACVPFTLDRIVTAANEAVERMAATASPYPLARPRSDAMAIPSPMPSWAATFTGVPCPRPGCGATHGSALDNLLAHNGGSNGVLDRTLARLAAVPPDRPGALNALLAPGRALDREQAHLAKDEAVAAPNLSCSECGSVNVCCGVNILGRSPMRVCPLHCSLHGGYPGDDDTAARRKAALQRRGQG